MARPDTTAEEANMNFPQAVQTCLKKYVDFTGRAGRPEFWWFFLAQVIVFAITGAISDILYMIAALGLLLPGLGVGARRLHDIGKSGWFLLLGLIPILGFLVLLYWFVQPSSPESNQWGAGPGAPADAPALPPGAV
jgi:uncharacterized membrane protein YhaH (DUF805 family)